LPISKCSQEYQWGDNFDSSGSMWVSGPSATNPAAKERCSSRGVPPGMMFLVSAPWLAHSHAGGSICLEGLQTHLSMWHAVDRNHSTTTTHCIAAVPHTALPHLRLCGRRLTSHSRVRRPSQHLGSQSQMSLNPQAWLPRPSNSRQARRHDETHTNTDWPLRHLDTLQLPPKVMALFPEWLFRSIRRDTIAHSPILAIERLNSHPRPLPEEDKEVLVGAVLTMSASLNLALGMLQELLPQEQSRERLGEVLCPTLGQLLASLEKVLPELNQKHSVHGMGTTSGTGASPPRTSQNPSHVQGNCHSPNRRHYATVATHRHPVTIRLPLEPRSPGASARPPSRQQGRVRSGRFLPVRARQDTDTEDEAIDAPSKPDTRLMQSLRAEMRVQAAIHVAIESLEFAEGQLKVMRMGGGEWPTELPPSADRAGTHFTPMQI
jgi:hypothetical protein